MDYINIQHSIGYLLFIHNRNTEHKQSINRQAIHNREQDRACKQEDRQNHNSPHRWVVGVRRIREGCQL